MLTVGGKTKDSCAEGNVMQEHKHGNRQNTGRAYGAVLPFECDLTALYEVNAEKREGVV